MLQTHSVDHGTAAMRRARIAGMGVHWPARPHLDVQVQMIVEPAEIGTNEAGTSGLVSIVVECGAKAVQGVRPPPLGVMTLNVFALGPLPMFTCASKNASTVRSTCFMDRRDASGGIHVKSHRAEGNRTAHIADQHALSRKQQLIKGSIK